MWRDRWSEAGFVGAAVMLRGCAKPLAVEKGKVMEWMVKLETLLCGEKVGFNVKSHAEVSKKEDFHSLCTRLITSLL